MSFKELILQRLKGKLGGKHSVNSGGFLPQSLPQSLPKNYQKFTKSLPAKSNTIGPKNCENCPYHGTGPDSFGKGVIHWCGPWRDANGDLHWLNIEELKACPKIEALKNKCTSDISDQSDQRSEFEGLEDYGGGCSDTDFNIGEVLS